MPLCTSKPRNPVRRSRSLWAFGDRYAAEARPGAALATSASSPDGVGYRGAIANRLAYSVSGYADAQQRHHQAASEEHRHRRTAGTASLVTSMHAAGIYVRRTDQRIMKNSMNGQRRRRGEGVSRRRAWRHDLLRRELCATTGHYRHRIARRTKLLTDVKNISRDEEDQPSAAPTTPTRNLRRSAATCRVADRSKVDADRPNA